MLMTLAIGKTRKKINFFKAVVFLIRVFTSTQTTIHPYLLQVYKKSGLILFSKKFAVPLLIYFPLMPCGKNRCKNNNQYCGNYQYQYKRRTGTDYHISPFIPS